MPLFSFLQRQSDALKVTWSLETPGSDEVIWKLLISPNGILVGEERNVQAKTGSLFAIDTGLGRVLWRHVRLDEPWWFGSERATEDAIYIQTFRQPDLPEPKGIIALNILTGKPRWTQPEMSFLFANGKSVYTMRQFFTRREYYSLDTLTGEVTETFGEDTSRISEVRAAQSDLDPNSFFANSLGESDEHFAHVQEILAETLDIRDLRGAIDYLEFERYLILSFHHRLRASADDMLQNLLASELLVIDTQSGNPIFRETLHRETPLPLPDNFFVSHRTLIYVKEKRLVAGVRLP